MLAGGKSDLRPEALEYAAVCISEMDGKVPKNAPYANELRERVKALSEP